MKLQQLKELIIKDGTEYIDDLVHDKIIPKKNRNERVQYIVDTINECDSPDDLICYYMDQGHSEREANEILYSYLIED